MSYILGAGAARSARVIGRERYNDLAVEAINDLLAHVDVVSRGRIICGCDLCGRWAAVCRLVLDCYRGPYITTPG